MKTYWYCTKCVAGGTENAAATMAQGHTKSTQHATMTTTRRELWLANMQKTATDREEGK